MNEEEVRQAAISVFAGEVVLGTSSRGDRSLVEEKLAADPVYQAELRAWEQRLAPLIDIPVPVAPPEELWARIAAETVDLLPKVVEDTPVVIDFESQLRARNRLLERSRRKWRWMAASGFGSALIAASIALLAVFAPEILPIHRVPDRYVAVINASGDIPPLMVSVDLSQGEIALRPVGIRPDPGKSFQLWAIEGEAKPVSLGLVASADRRKIDALPRKAWLNPDLLLAVSMEPEGGSPTGLPTGPVVYKGRLIVAD